MKQKNALYQILDRLRSDGDTMTAIRDIEQIFTTEEDSAAIYNMIQNYSDLVPALRASYAKYIIESEIASIQNPSMYWRNPYYETRSRIELLSLMSAAKQPLRSIAVVGSGPLPMTAISLSSKVDRVVAIDRDDSANHYASLMCEGLNNIEIVSADFNKINHHIDVDAIIFAGTVELEANSAADLRFQVKSIGGARCIACARIPVREEIFLYRDHADIEFDFKICYSSNDDYFARAVIC